MRQHVPEEGVHFIQANGLQFGYLEQGEGPLVLLMHGFPDTARSWDHVRPALAAAGYRAVSPFLRGYAPSGIPTEDADTETLGKDVLALIEALGHDKAIVVGHDYGALSTYSAAAQDPDRFEKMVTVAIPHPLSIKPSLGMAWKARHFVTLRLPGAVGRFCANDFAAVDAYYKRWSPTWDIPEAETESAKNAFAAPGSANAAVGYYRAMQLPGPKFLRRKLELPTMVVAGVDAPNVAVDVFHQAERRFKGPYRVEALPGGHWVHRESPERFVEVLLDSIKG